MPRSMDDLIANTPEMRWLESASCAELPIEELELFFVEAGRTIAASTVARCERCPVRLDCLEHAYRHDIASGYFGGMSPGRRRRITLEEARREIGAVG